MEIQFNRNDRLGEGGYGSVFAGMFKNRRVAVKRVELIHATDNEEALKQLDHLNIVKLFHVECTEDFKHFALELCDASLDQIFLEPENPRKYKGPKLPHHFEIFSQLASGLKYIHSKNLIHRDIKPGNVLISVDSTSQEDKVIMKWADFGLSRSVNERGTYEMSSRVRGTRNWYAPELLELLNEVRGSSMERRRGTVKSDVFALGLVITFLILDGQHLYGSTEIDINNNIMKGNMININKFERLHYAYDLIQKMLKNKPKDRISSSDIVEQLKSIKITLEEKQKEMFKLCVIKDPVFSLLFPRTNQTEKLKILIRQGIDVNRKYIDGNNALHCLCGFNSSAKLIDAIKLLNEKGIDVNEKNNDGNNALHILCRYNSSERLIDAIKLLIQIGIDVNGKNNIGNNALNLLCVNNSSEKLMDAIELLIQLGIDVNGKNNDGWNALHMLCATNSSEKLMDAIELLIQLGINVNEKIISRGNALHVLCQFHSSERLLDAIELLIYHGIDVDEIDKDGDNALLCLCLNNSNKRFIDAIELLIQLGIDVNGKSKYGNNALHLICQLNPSGTIIDEIRLLIQHGIDVNAKNNNGTNALYFLCANNSSDKLIEAIKLLIQLGIDVTSNEFDARLILRENYFKGNLVEIIKLLDAASLS